jgi:hypothetical protein
MLREITTTTFGMTNTLPIEMQTKTKKGQYLFINLSPKLTQASLRQTRWKESQPPTFVFTLREDAAVRGQTADTTIECRLSQIY